MILPSFKLPTRINQRWNYSGLDTVENCKDLEHFKNYPYTVNYEYNSRGFRDKEWPDSVDQLSDSIWCVGDSFTVGIGSPIEYTWVSILQNLCNRRGINISLDGASNFWIARRAIEILQTIKPKFMVIHWSYISRAEDSNEQLSDEERRIAYGILDDIAGINFLKNLVEDVNKKNQSTKLCHSIIPYFSSIDTKSIENGWENCRGINWPEFVPQSLEEYKSLPSWLLKELDYHGLDRTNVEFCSILNEIYNSSCWIKEIRPVDYGRDGFHYGKITSTLFAESVKLNLLAN